MYHGLAETSEVWLLYIHVSTWLLDLVFIDDGGNMNLC
jgi:hypothetical protein